MRNGLVAGKSITLAYCDFLSTQHIVAVVPAFPLESQRWCYSNDKQCLVNCPCYGSGQLQDALLSRKSGKL